MIVCPASTCCMGAMGAAQAGPIPLASVLGDPIVGQLLPNVSMIALVLWCSPKAPLPHIGAGVYGKACAVTNTD